MRWLSFGVLEELSPIGALTAGLAIGSLATPALGKGLRALTYAAVKGVIVATDQVRDAGEKVKEEWNNIVTEAEAQRQLQKRSVKSDLYNADIDVAEAGVKLIDEAKNAVVAVKEDFRDIVEKTGNASKVAAVSAVNSSLEVNEESRNNLNDNNADITIKKRRGRVKTNLGADE